MTNKPVQTPRSELRETLALVVLGVVVLVVGLFAARLIRGRVVASPPGPVVASVPIAAQGISNRGPLLFQVHCLRCHGPEGHGDGPDAASLRPPPRDFASTDWKFGATPEAIRKVILQGIPGTSMYALGTSLSNRELDALVGHVRQLAPKRGASGEDVVSPPPFARLKAAGFETINGRRPAPRFEVEGLDGKSKTLDFDRAKLTLLVFWGTSCAPCQEELPELEKLAIDFRGRGLEVVPVCVDEADRQRVGRIIQGKFDRFPSFVNVDGLARLKYDIQTLPMAVLIDRNGEMVGVSRGGVEWTGEPARQVIAEGLESKD